MNKISKNLMKFGYDDFFESSRKKLGLDDFPVARVVAEHKGAYRLTDQDGEFWAKVSGKKMFDSSSREDFPAVGDWVAINKIDADQAVVQGILPRRTIIKRRFGDENRSGNKTDTQIIGTNIDVAFIVESIDRDYNLNRLERYFAIVSEGGVKPTVILNKTDLISKEDLELKIDQIKKRFSDIDVIPASTVNGEGLDILKKYIEGGKTYCFLGSSGVGKSSLINKLLTEDTIKTKAISRYSGRGRHTTTSRALYFLEDGGIVMDNPGVREIGMADTGDGVEDTFEEINTMAEGCKYADCTHAHEPGCAVLRALKSGELDEARYSNYVRIKKELVHNEMTDFEKREKGRQFGKFVKKVKKDMEKYRY